MLTQDRAAGGGREDGLHSLHREGAGGGEGEVQEHEDKEQEEQEHINESKHGQKTYRDGTKNTRNNFSQGEKLIGRPS